VYKKDTKINAKKILKKIIAGRYFNEKDYFTKEQLKSFQPFVDDFREFLKNKRNKNYFKRTIKLLIFSSDVRKVFLGVNFGRCYLYDKVICSKLRKLAVNAPNNSFQIQIQVIYELLVGKRTYKEKQEWYTFLIKNIRKYKQLFRQVYGLRTDKKKEKYFKKIRRKISKAESSKQWIYLIELVVLGVNKKETSKIIIKYVNSKDKFVSKVAKECLKRL
jgi:hypothetical protein